MAVNERDGGGNVSITAGLVLNELRMCLLSLLGRARERVRAGVYSCKRVHARLLLHYTCSKLARFG